MEQDHQSAPRPSADELLTENSKLHPPSRTQGDVIHSTTEDTEILTAGEHDNIEIDPQLTLCYQLRLASYHLI